MIALWLGLAAVAGSWWPGSTTPSTTPTLGQVQIRFNALEVDDPAPLPLVPPEIRVIGNATVQGEPEWDTHLGGPVALVIGDVPTHVQTQWLASMTPGESAELFVADASLQTSLAQAISFLGTEGSILALIGPNQDVPPSAMDLLRPTNIRLSTIAIQPPQLRDQGAAPGFRELTTSTGGLFVPVSSPEEAVGQLPRVRNRLRERIRLSIELCHHEGTKDPFIIFGSGSDPKSDGITQVFRADTLPTCTQASVSRPDVGAPPMKTEAPPEEAKQVAPPADVPPAAAPPAPRRAVASWRWIVAACLIAIGAGTMGWVLLRKRTQSPALAPQNDAPSGHLIQPHPTPDSADAPTLRITRGPGIEGQIIRLQAASMRFGEDDECAVIIEGLSLAGTHVTFERFPGDTVFITDQSGLSGTWVNDERLAAKERRRIHHGDAIRLGPHLDLVFELPNPEST